MRVSVIASILVLSPVIAACDDMCADKACVFTSTELNIAKSMSPLPDAPPDPTNRFSQNEEAATLGKKLFYEKRYSAALKVSSGLGAVAETGKVACVSCHLAPTYGDTRSLPSNLSVGVSWTLRNAPALVNNVYYKWHNWSGNRTTLWDQASFSPETGTNTAGDRCTYAHMLWDFYRAEYDALVPDAPLSDRLDPMSTDPIPLKCKPKANATAPNGPWELMSEADIAAGRPATHTQDIVLQIMCTQGKFVAAYESQLVSRNARFDQYVAGDEDALTLKEKMGLKLFVGKASCSDCHRGPFFTDQQFHNIGVPQTGPNVPATDNGRFDTIPELPKSNCQPNGPFSDDPSVDWLEGLEATDADRGAFRTASLRNVAETAPYMHTGGFVTLRDVVEFYNRGGDSSGFSGTKHPSIRPLGLTATEIDQLLAFLETLTGEALPSALMAAPTLPGVP